MTILPLHFFAVSSPIKKALASSLHDARRFSIAVRFMCLKKKKKNPKSHYIFTAACSPWLIFSWSMTKNPSTYFWISQKLHQPHTHCARLRIKCIICLHGSILLPICWPDLNWTLNYRWHMCILFFLINCHRTTKQPQPVIKGFFFFQFCFWSEIFISKAKTKRERFGSILFNSSFWIKCLTHNGGEGRAGLQWTCCQVVLFSRANTTANKN